eukprot:TRINITY_DN5723_c0_g1_i21.p1 TRINITY_DN5723_c0_g1~~TRINITY_DN5723_c0_g1_i21.p1  ORF type:complete len:474 (-),score=99.42 TRINITY_DN5723_c0_g1_i21:323-1744(-)
MERENDRTRRKYKKEESARIRKLVDFALDRDPRIMRHKQFEKEEKERKRKEKYNNRQAEKNALADKQAAAEAARAAEEAAAKDQAKSDKEKRQALKKQLKFERKKITKLCAAAIQEKPEIQWELDMCIGAGDHPDVPMDMLQFYLFEWEQIPDVKALIETIERTAQETKLANETARLEAKSASAQQIAKAKADQEAESAARQVEWTSEEQRLLVKGVKKFPAGMANRWGRIAEFIGGRHSEAEVIKVCKSGLNFATKETNAFEEFLQVKNSSSSASKEKDKQEKMQADESVAAWSGAKLSERMEGAQNAAQDRAVAEARQDAAQQQVAKEVAEQEASGRTAIDAAASEWTMEEQKALEAALKKYPSSDKERWDKIAADVGKTRKQVVKRCKEIRDQAANQGAAAEKATPSRTQQAPAHEWTPEEQQALEAALRKHPSSDKERWDKIAAEIGKTKKQVVKRCKDIRDNLAKVQN